MRKMVLRSLREEFKKQIKSRFSMFSPAELKQRAAGADLYVWKFSENLNFFVYLLPNPKSYHDTFMIELGWSGAGAYPVGAPLQNKQRLDLRSDGRIRLPSLWREQWRSGLEPWWAAGESLGADTGDEFYGEEETLRRVSRVPQLTADAVGKIEQYGIPFFQKIVAEWPRSL